MKTGFLLSGPIYIMTCISFMGTSYSFYLHPGLSAFKKRMIEKKTRKSMMSVWIQIRPDVLLGLICQSL